MPTFTRKSIERRDYPCSRVNRTVAVVIQSEIKSRFEDFREIATIKTLQQCEGLDHCGVKTTHASGESFDWNVCPLITTLKT